LFLFVFVLFSNTFFTGAPPPVLRHIFITHLLICHSFLDFLYMDDWAVGSHANLKGRRPGGLRGTESPVQEARGLTGVHPCEIRDLLGFTMRPEN
jgi:hypothetical protein